MLRRIRITPGTAIAILALVLAASGGALAATGNNSSGASRASAAAHKTKAKAKPGPRGPAGPAGKQGAQGLVGPAGPAGPAGAQGAKGETGAKGAPGAEGPEGPEGPEGEAGHQGTPGNPGTPGQPWTPNNVLPSGATETGTWGGRPAEKGESVLSTISLSVALASELDSEHVHLVPDEPEATGTGNLEKNIKEVTGVTATSGEFKPGAGIEDTTHPADIPAGTTITSVGPGEFTMSASATATAAGDELKAGNPPGCPDGASAKKPAADKGNLCVYVGENLLNNAVLGGPYKPYELFAGGSGTAGALINIEGGTSPNLVFGAWAVTAE